MLEALGLHVHTLCCMAACADSAWLQSRLADSARPDMHMSQAGTPVVALQRQKCRGEEGLLSRASV